MRIAIAVRVTRCVQRPRLHAQGLPSSGTRSSAGHFAVAPPVCSLCALRRLRLQTRRLKSATGIQAADFSLVAAWPTTAPYSP